MNGITIRMFPKGFKVLEVFSKSAFKHIDKMMEREQTLGCEHTMWYIGDILQDCTPKTYETLVTIITPINFN